MPPDTQLEVRHAMAVEHLDPGEEAGDLDELPGLLPQRDVLPRDEDVVEARGFSIHHAGTELV
ncbi:hypothetical protein DSO57_1020500 [Entomophthora muscae]|uniref:Uncharacterized protein n=1 Tax=Entomophthora muscae TaxID=34485 RepID=A0ACC2UPA2_9FUNG|nr:hypothetical protein DSO57_1020500 [Entomophthora muscae]